MKGITLTRINYQEEESQEKNELKYDAAVLTKAKGKFRCKTRSNSMENIELFTGNEQRETRRKFRYEMKL